MDFMIRLRESVRVVQFAKKSCLFVRSFVRSLSRVSGSSESFAESFRLSSSLHPSFSFANRESLVHNIQTNHKCTMQFSQLSRSRSDSLVLISQTNHEITIRNRAMAQMVINQHNIN